MKTIHRNIVVALLFSKDGKLLQALQSPFEEQIYPNHWGLIGGGVEEGESNRVALNREIMEETGMDVSKYKAELIDKDEGEAEKTLRNSKERVLCKMEFYTYKIIIDDKYAKDINVVLNDEHTEYRWSDASDLGGLQLTPPSVKLFSKLGYLA